MPLTLVHVCKLGSQHVQKTWQCLLPESFVVKRISGTREQVTQEAAYTSCSLAFKISQRFKVSMQQAADTSQQPSESLTGRVKTSCLSMAVTFKEGLSYVKAFFVGQTKRLTAKNEKEATEAHLTETKMQVDATDEAENAKKRLHQSS